MVWQRWLPFMSYSLLSEMVPAPGQEIWHCDTKRGFKRVRKKEPEVAAVLDEDTSIQRIGLLAQQIVYEFHQQPSYLEDSAGLAAVAKLIELDQQEPTVQERVYPIIEGYFADPILKGREVLYLASGQEGYSTEDIEIQHSGTKFKLYAALDCLLEEEDGTLHILDFKTGKSGFDSRQAYIYLLYACYRYPGRKATASFYNLETGQNSDPITAKPEQLWVLEHRLVELALKHQQQMQAYRRNPETFVEIYPPNPYPKRCRACQFQNLCEFSAHQE